MTALTNSFWASVSELAEVVQRRCQQQQVAPADVSDLLVEGALHVAAHGIRHEVEGQRVVHELVEDLERVEVDVEAMIPALCHASQGAELADERLAAGDLRPDGLKRQEVCEDRDHVGLKALAPAHDSVEVYLLRRGHGLSAVQLEEDVAPLRVRQIEAVGWPGSVTGILRSGSAKRRSRTRSLMRPTISKELPGVSE